MSRSHYEPGQEALQNEWYRQEEEVPRAEGRGSSSSSILMSPSVTFYVDASGGQVGCEKGQVAEQKCGCRSPGPASRSWGWEVGLEVQR